MEPARVAREDLGQAARHRARRPRGRGARARPRSPRAGRDPTLARFFGPPSVRTSVPPSSSVSLKAGVFGCFAPGSWNRRRPALIRCTWRTSSPSSVGKRRCLPRRPRAGEPSDPRVRRSGGSNVFSVAMCAGPALATRRGARARSPRGGVSGPRSRENSGIDVPPVDAISVSVRRGDVVESRHRVHAVFVQAGEVVEAWGDAELVTHHTLGREALPGARARP